MRIRERIGKFIAPSLRNDTEIREIVSDEIRRARMALPITANYDPNNEGYRRLSGDGNMRRDLSAITQDRMFEIAYFMFDNSAMVKGLATMDKSFLFAEPLTIECDDPDAQAVVDEFWEENNLEIEFPEMMMWLSLLGEQCWPVTVNKFNGSVKIGYTDPSLIKDIWVNRMNVKEMFLVEMQGTAGRSGEKMRIVGTDQDLYSKGFGKLTGECFFYSINHPLNSPRGRSDYLTLFDWIDGLERYGFNYLERAEFMLNFVWDVMLRGYDESRIRDWLAENPPPSPGALRAHNENVEWKAVAPDIKAYDFRQGFDMAKGFVMGSLRRPESWYGGGGKAYQTEAEQFGQVPIKDLSQRQLLIKKIAGQLVRFKLDQAVIAGRLTEAQGAADFSVDMAEISQKDMQKMVNGLPQAATALTIAQQNKWITQETATQIFAFLCTMFGKYVDPDQQIEEAEKAPEEGTEDYMNNMNDNKLKKKAVA